MDHQNGDNWAQNIIALDYNLLPGSRLVPRFWAFRIIPSKPNFSKLMKDERLLTITRHGCLNMWKRSCHRHGGIVSFDFSSKFYYLNFHGKAAFSGVLHVWFARCPRTSTSSDLEQLGSGLKHTKPPFSQNQSTNIPSSLWFSLK